VLVYNHFLLFFLVNNFLIDSLPPLSTLHSDLVVSRNGTADAKLQKGHLRQTERLYLLLFSWLSWFLLVFTKHVVRSLRRLVDGDTRTWSKRLR
jgi:hypothetical protein